MDVQDLEPRFIFVKEETLTLPDGPRFGHATNGAPKMVRASQGGVVGRMPGGRMMWLASWLKVGNRYTLEQMRANLPETMRFDLEYRDAITIAFFAAYMLPQMNGLLVGFGTGNIFRRLNREAPMGAIRRSIRDTMSARSHGMRASGLEDYFADLMREAGALDKDQGLEAVHGAEPLHLYTSSYSGCYFFAWDSTLPFSASLRALNIEGNLNRFAAVSSWLERNARIGKLPTEDTVTRAEAAQIDMALLENPALIALKPDDEFGAILDSQQDDGVQASCAWWTSPRKPDVPSPKNTRTARMVPPSEPKVGDGYTARQCRDYCAACACHTASTWTSDAASKTAIWPSVSPLPAFP